MQRIRIAKTYIEKGLSVIPVAKDKRPIISWKEFQSRRATNDELIEWFLDTDNNIGIVTGKISGITVIDVEKGGDISIWPKTLMSKTGGGGYHLYYKYQKDLKNLVRIKELTDIRNDGGYVIAPNSVSNKGSYEWLNKEEMIDFPIDILNPKKKKENLPEFAGVNDGSRNDSMIRYVGLLLPFIHPSEWNTKGWDKVQEANKKNTPELTDYELKNIFNYVIEQEKLDPTIRKIESNDIEQSDDNEILLMSDVASQQKTDHLQTYSTGFNKFDEAMLGGFKEGDLIIVTAQTGQGKTTFAQTLTCNITKNNTGVLFFSYEVMVANIWKKFEEMGMGKKSIVYSPIKTISGSLDWVEKRILDAINKYDIKVVVVDHLGFLLPRTSKYDNNINQNYSAYLGNICREIKTISLKHKLISMLLVHTRKTDKPTINDIRDSSGIAQEADHVFILERLLSNNKDDRELSIYSDETYISLVKNRLTGQTPKIKCRLQSSKFVELYDTSDIIIE